MSGLVLIIFGALGSVLEILNATTARILWSVGILLVVVALLWLTSALRYVGDTWNRWCGFAGAIFLLAGSGILGWITNATFAEKSPTPPRGDPTTAPSNSASTAPPQDPGTAAITSPKNGAGVDTCTVVVHFDGAPATGKAFVAVTNQKGAAYYFEPQISPDGPNKWSASVQVGENDLTSDEEYTVSIYQMHEDWIEYLGTVLANAAADWDIATQVDATYWNTDRLPPGAGKPLHAIAVHRTKADPNCPA
ncbi:hypothetical protein ACFQV6_27120 [Actinoplanes sp. GCM10030250]